MKGRFPEYFWGILTLALATVVAAFVIGASVRQIRGSQDVITVTGSARRPIRSDFVVWRGAVASQKPTMQDAYKDVKRYTERVQAYLRTAGIPDSAITYPAIDNEQIPEFLSSGQPSGRIAAYRLQQRFEVRSGQVDRIATLARQSSELITEGVPLTSSSPEFLYTKLAEVRVDMLAEATTDAKTRATRIAEAAGSKVRILRSARMGVFQITARNSTEVSDYGIYDPSSLEKDITAVVSLSFALD
jgi:uncharacterized protein